MYEMIFNLKIMKNGYNKPYFRVILENVTEIKYKKLLFIQCGIQIIKMFPLIFQIPMFLSLLYTYLITI